MIHELKISPHQYKSVDKGVMTYQVRMNDRGFLEGEKIILKEFIRALKPPYFDQKLLGYVYPKEPVGYTASPILYFTIGTIYDLKNGYVVLALTERTY